MLLPLYICYVVVPPLLRKIAPRKILTIFYKEGEKARFYDVIRVKALGLFLVVEYRDGSTQGFLQERIASWAMIPNRTETPLPQPV